MGLPIDESEIRRDVFRRDPGANARRMAELEEEVQLLIRERKARIIVQFYAARRAPPSPAELFKRYQDNIDQYTRVGRLRPMRILLPPPAAPPTTNEMMFMLRDTQRFADLQPAFTDELREAYIAADADSPELRAVLEQLANNIITLAAERELDANAQIFVELVSEIHQQLNNETVDPETKLGDIRQGILAQPAEQRD